jgi:thymidylate kinase
MLVTVSGIVGGGKTTTAKIVTERLRHNAIEPVEVWNFRRLACFARLSRRAPDSLDGFDAVAPAQRGVNYAPRTFTAALAVGYAVRIVSFRRYRFRRRGTHHVCNRYFYDNFAHFALRTRRERFWLALLRFLIPTPDLAILVVASPSTISHRRSNYAPEYLSAVAAAYERLPGLFPELRTVSTDSDDATALVSDLAGALRHL